MDDGITMTRSYLRLLAIFLLAIAPATAVAERVTPYLAMQMADYPPDALAAHVEGDVPIVVHIRPDGSIQDCSAKPSGRLASLARASCAIVAQRALFKPATDKSGQPVPQMVKMIARWVIPADPQDTEFGGATPISPGYWVWSQDYPAPAQRAQEEGSVEVGFRINTSGRLTDCKVTKSSGSALLDSTTCDILTARASFLPAVDANGAVRDTTGHWTLTWKMPDD
jgi:TonB family protein